jgi:hypothetical protein
VGKEGGAQSAERTMQITAEVARLQLDAPRQIPPATLERLRSEIVPAFVDARTNYYASTTRLQERRVEVEKDVQGRIAKTPEVQRAEAAKQAYDASPSVQAANAEKTQAMTMAAVAAWMDVSVAKMMQSQAEAQFESQVHDLPETAELRNAIGATRALIDAEAVQVNLELYPVMREVEEAQSRLSSARDNMLLVAGIRSGLEVA